MWGATKKTGEANMYPKPVQDLQGWNTKEITCGNTSIGVLADDSVIVWGPSPCYGELVIKIIRISVLGYNVFIFVFLTGPWIANEEQLEAKGNL